LRGLKYAVQVVFAREDRQVNYNKLLKDNYPAIKNRVHFAAFKFNLREDDLLSMVHFRLAKYPFDESKSSFMTYAGLLIMSVAKDLYGSNHTKYSRNFIELETAFDIGYTPAETIDNKNQLEAIRRYVDRMPKKLVDVFNVHFIDGFKYEEASAALNIPINTVKSRLFQVRGLVKSKFSNPLA